MAFDTLEDETKHVPKIDRDNRGQKDTGGFATAGPKMPPVTFSANLLPVVPVYVAAS